MTQLESNIVNNPYCVGGSMSDISIDNLYFQIYRKFSFVSSMDGVKKEIKAKLMEMGFKTIAFHVDSNKEIALEDAINDFEGTLLSSRNNFLSNVIFLLNEKESILIRIYEETTENYDLMICTDEELKLSKIVEFIGKYQITEDRGIGVLYSMGSSVAIRTVKIKKPEIDIDLNYGEHFGKVHNKIISELNKNTNGLFLFHGVMGCISGDTKIRVLVKNKNGKKLFNHINTINHYYHKMNNLYLKNKKGKLYPWDSSERSVYTLSVDPKSNYLFNNRIEKIIYSGIKPVYKIITKSGKFIKTTKDHKIYTPNGFAALIDLKIGDYVGIRSVIKNGYRKKPRRYFEYYVKYHPSKLRLKKIYCNKVKKTYYFYRINYCYAIYEAFLNNLTLEQYISILNDPETSKKNDLKYINTSTHEIHHKDRNWKNNNLNNLDLLTKENHRKLHIDSIQGSSENVWDEILSIDYVGEEDTFDIQMENPYNSFVGNDFILHNSGKTTYIKYLSQLANRLFIFVPTGMVESLVSPSLISTLLHHQNAVLILEDAEKAIESRSFNENTSLVSTILNLSDGILGTILNTAIIATFNTEKENIDKALLRKGRLKLEHKFEKLSVKEVQKLINKLNKKYEVTEPMSLADIYNIDEDNLHVEESSSSIGFK